MKTIKLILFICFLFLGKPTFALDFRTKAPVYNHLIEVNKQWQNHQDYAPSGSMSFTSDVERISYHLHQVEAYLRIHTPAGLSVSALQNRSALLDTLLHYADARQFPINNHHSQRTPYFIDDFGTHCAVGYLIKASGHDALALRISKEYNYNYLADIHTPGIAEWAAAHGFSFDELAWIQPDYMPETKFSPLQKGTNASVEGILTENYYGKVIFWGGFDKVNDLPCIHIGQYYKDQLSCLGEGLEGVINAVDYREDDILVAGYFKRGDSSYPLAIYNSKDKDWRFVDIPGRPKAVGTAIYSNGIDIYFSMQDSINSKHGEIWYNVKGQWENKIRINGSILCIAGGGKGLAFGGSFDSVTITSGNDAGKTLIAHNAIINTDYGKDWIAVDPGIEGSVQAIMQYGNALYFSGTCEVSSSKAGVCLSRYYNGTVQPLILADYFRDMQSSISVLKMYDENNLMFGGSFYRTPIGEGYYIRNLARYNLSTNSISSMAYFNGKVTGIGWNSDWIIGGEFTSNIHDSLPYLARINRPDAVEVIEKGAFKVYPNPAQNQLHIQGQDANSIRSVQVLDMLGRNVYNAKLTATGHDLVLDVSSLEKGLYLLAIETQNHEPVRERFEVVR